MINEFIIKILEKIMSQLGGFLPTLPDFLRRRSFYPLQTRGFIVSVTTRCNFNCPHCLRGEIDKNKVFIRDLPVDVFETVLKEGRKLDFRFVSFTGGEPILHPHFKELVALTVKYGYRFNFATNGWIHKEYWEAIKANIQKLDAIFLSLDGVTSDVHDFVRNKPGSFDKMMETIKFYNSHNLPLIATFCVTKNNLHQVELLPEFCLKMGIKTIKWATVISVYDENGNPITKTALTDIERTAVFRKIKVMEDKFKFRCKFVITRSFYPLSGNEKTFLWCPILDCSSIYIDHDGAMFFCCDINRECANKPLVGEKGFENSLNIAIDSANEMKKKNIMSFLNGKDIPRFCDFCNQNIESCLDIAIRRQSCG